MKINAGVLLGLLLSLPVMADESRTSFTAQSMELDGLHGDITIVTGSEKTVHWTNAKEMGSIFQGKVTNGVLRFTQKANSGTSGISVQTHGGVTVVESGVGNKVSVNVGGSGSNTSVVVNSKPPPRLELTVPKGIAMVVRRASGTWRIGDLQGPMDFTLSSGDADIGRVGPSILTVKGAGDIRVQEVTGRLKATVDGSGEVNVMESQLDDLEVMLDGTGDVTVGGVARRAKVMLRGTGDVTINKVEEKPSVQVDGVGDVRIGGW